MHRRRKHGLPVACEPVSINTSPWLGVVPAEHRDCPRACLYIQVRLRGPSDHQSAGVWAVNPNVCAHRLHESYFCSSNRSFYKSLALHSSIQHSSWKLEQLAVRGGQSAGPCVGAGAIGPGAPLSYTGRSFTAREPHHDTTGSRATSIGRWGPINRPSCWRLGRWWTDNHPTPIPRCQLVGGGGVSVLCLPGLYTLEFYNHLIGLTLWRYQPHLNLV